MATGNAVQSVTGLQNGREKYTSVHWNTTLPPAGTLAEIFAPRSPPSLQARFRSEILVTKSTTCQRYVKDFLLETAVLGPSPETLRTTLSGRGDI